MNPSKNDFTSNNWNLMSTQPVSDPSTDTVIQSFDLTVKSKLLVNGSKYKQEICIRKRYYLFCNNLMFGKYRK